jgi:hypothetical protein
MQQGFGQGQGGGRGQGGGQGGGRGQGGQGRGMGRGPGTGQGPGGECVLLTNGEHLASSIPVPSAAPRWYAREIFC